MGGAGADGWFRDALKHIRVALGLGFLPRTVPKLTIRPSLSSNGMQLIESNSIEFMHIAEDAR